MPDTGVGENTVALSIAQEILTTSVKIPTLPDNGQKIITMVRTPKDQIDIPVFVKLLESDPGLFTRILKLANSPYYKGVNEVVSIRGAITRIGLVEAVNTVSFYFFQRLLPRFPDIPGFAFNSFWEHSWACAAACRRLGHPNLEMAAKPGDLYMAGMLQGIGKLLLSIHFPDRFTRCIALAAKRQMPLWQITTDVFGASDNRIASKVLGVWHLPPPICEAVAFCHSPERAAPEYRLLSGLTQYGYSIAGMSGMGNSGDGSCPDVADTYLGRNPKVKIGQADVREKLIPEIVSSLSQKEKKRSPANPAASDRGAAQEPVSKKSVFSWIKSVFQ